ncbi:MAG: dihydroneopterin aldolase [Betaproteobacteria bacterium]|nr:dihydroneopterin aldolase [Candidatus Dechloromonas phosphorivorans]
MLGGVAGAQPKMPASMPIWGAALLCLGVIIFCCEGVRFVLANHWCASVDATIQLRTGCNPLEKHGPQAVLVHADAWAPMAAVANPHDIHDVVDYEVIFLAIRKLEKNDHCICLESSILEIMDAIFSISVVTSALSRCTNRMSITARERRLFPYQ